MTVCNCLHCRGTLVVPGSHKLISEVGAGNPVGPLPPAVNAQCPAGTIVMFEGRLLHGTGVNKTDRPRRMYVGNSLKANFRQQEIWTLSLKPELLPQLTEKMVYRMGLHPMGLGGAEGDWAADLRYWRSALDDGTYLREYCISRSLLSPTCIFRRACLPRGNSTDYIVCCSAACCYHYLIIWYLVQAFVHCLQTRRRKS